MKSLGIGLIGCGVVGGGVVRHADRNREWIVSRCGLDLCVERVAVRDVTKARGVDPSRLTDDWRKVVNDPSVEVVVELMGGMDLAFEVAEATLNAGKPLVTANKALLAERGAALFRLASEKKAPIFFEASVAGGIPIVKALSEGLRANRIERIIGIINGTCNYILTRMERERLPFADILAEAKDLGYAEADERLDVDGLDAAHKAAILAALAFGRVVTFEQVYVEGIRSITPLDMQFADTLGYTIKLLAIMRQHVDGKIEVRVHPALVAKAHVLSTIHGVFNAVQVFGDVVGQTLFYGRGAGADPTASAVLADVIEAGLVLHGGCSKPCAFNAHEPAELLSMDEVMLPYYVRLTVLNQPGVLARVASILGAHQIGISSVFQPEGHHEQHVPLVFLLDRAREADMRAAMAEIKQLDVVKDPCQVIRVEELL
ncbi:MAG: homoserine dehydrogenase [Candidatus Methylacidiphilales bacterium]